VTALPHPDQFTPEQLAAAGPGWTEARRVQFLHTLAQQGNVRAACARVGLSREAAYTLRRRDPAFARGWAAAMVLANDAAGEELATRAMDGIEEEVWSRGEVVGTRRKFDTRLFLAHLARLDKAAGCAKARADAARFDELLAVIGGEPVPEELIGNRDEVLPLDRVEAANHAADAASAELDAEAKDDPEVGALSRDEYDDAVQDAYYSGLELFDDWQASALDVVDGLLGRAAEISPRTVSGVSSSALVAGLIAGSEEAGIGTPPTQET